MHVTLDIQLGDARDRRHRLTADVPRHRSIAAIPFRARIALGARRAHSRSATALARRRAGELLPGRG